MIRFEFVPKEIGVYRESYHLSLEKLILDSI